MKKSPFQTRVSKVSGLSPFKEETDTELTVDKEAISNVENYYNKLLTSDIHKGRARNMYGGADAQSILDARLNRLRTAKYENVSQEDWDAVVKKAEEQIAEAEKTGDYSKIARNMKKDPYMPVQSKYDRKTGTITASGPQAEDQGWDIESIIANEMSHHLGSLTSKSVTNTPYNIGRYDYEKGDYAMSLGETALIDESFKEGKRYGYKVGDRDHDQRNHEVKSDIDTLRYELYKLGVYDATSEVFTQEHLNKAREVYKDDPKKLSRIDALEDNFEDDKLINLMNKLVMEQSEEDGDPNRALRASNKGQSTPMSMRINPKTGLSPFNDETDTGEESEQGWLASATEGIRKNLADNLTPYGYWDPLERLYKAGVEDEKSRTRANMEEYGIEKKVDWAFGEYNSNIERVDLLNIVMGQPQKYDSMQESEYKPTESKDPDATYYRSKQTEREIKGAIDSVGVDKVVSESQYLRRYDYQPGRRGGSVLGTYKIDKGVDEKGHYISYYDIWDLNPIPETGVDAIDIGVGKVASYLTGKAGMTNPEIYGRIYYDPKTDQVIE